MDKGRGQVQFRLGSGLGLDVFLAFTVAFTVTVVVMLMVTIEVVVVVRNPVSLSTFAAYTSAKAFSTLSAPFPASIGRKGNWISSCRNASSAPSSRVRVRFRVGVVVSVRVRLRVRTGGVIMPQVLPSGFSARRALRMLLHKRRIAHLCIRTLRFCVSHEKGPNAAR